MKRRPLHRNASRGAQIALTFGLGVLLGALALAPLVLPRPILLAKIVATGFGIVSLLLLYSAIHQVFALRTPQTAVEIDVDELKRGGAVQLFMRQPGDGDFESLRVNLVGEERWTVGRGRRRRRMVAHLATVNLFDSGPFQAPWEREANVRVPADLPRATDKTRAERWRFEVWGKVRGRADFQHVFPVKMKP